MKKVKEEKQADLKFVDSNELKAIKDRQEAVDKYLFEVGVIESRKHALLHELSEANKRLESYKEILMDKYGPINVNMADGNYNPLKDGK
jgi:hypothetical protein